MGNSVPVLSIVIMGINILLGIMVPLLLVLWLRKKYGCSIKAFFVGVAVMIVFAGILEQMVHMVVLNSGAGAVLTGNIWYYGLYGGLMAGLFEETGRFLAFKTTLKNSRDKDQNAFMYGVGHGGYEMFSILSIGMLNNLLYSLMINTGSASMLTNGLTEEVAVGVETAIAQLTGSSPAVFLLSPVERLAAFTVQMAFSVLVWFAAKNGGKWVWLYPAAILLHLLLDGGAVILNSYTGNALLVEVAIWIFAVLCAFLAYRVYRANTQDKM